MHLRVLDLDGSVRAQTGLVRRFRPEVADLSAWGPWLRLACRHGTFRRFERRLGGVLGRPDAGPPTLAFLGSGDFHHVTLALLRRLRGPFNLLVIDKHPDWVRGVPLLHCGTWLAHALRLPSLRRVFHVGGDVDFDNHYRWLAPWGSLHSGRVVVVPARRRFRRGRWEDLVHHPLARPGGLDTAGDALAESLGIYRAGLGQCPLYISVDKDAMRSAEAVVNWDSGSLTLRQVLGVLDWFLDAARGRLLGADVVGDWSPVRLRWGVRTVCHWAEHPKQHVHPSDAARVNARANEQLTEYLLGWRLGARRLVNQPYPDPVGVDAGTSSTTARS
jgi:hypothetical protein